MSQWGSRKARLVLAALLKIGWRVKRQSGTSHKILSREPAGRTWSSPFMTAKKLAQRCWPASPAAPVCSPMIYDHS